MNALQDVLTSFRQASASEREKGTYFEDLIRSYAVVAELKQADRGIGP